MTRRKRRIITIGPVKGEPGWWGWTDTHGTSGRQRKKADIVRIMRRICRENQPSQLRIKGRDGRIQTEHTYGADPRRYKG
jgi:hypothetical protein